MPYDLGANLKLSIFSDYHTHLEKNIKGAIVEYFTILGTILDFQHWNFRLCQVRIM